MNGPLTTAAMVLALSAGSLTFGVGVHNIVDPTPQTRSLIVGNLEYSSGYFTQELLAEPTGLEAHWVAEIREGETIVCPSVGGTAPYGYGPVRLSVNDWIGSSTCEAKLTTGNEYKAIASWEYEDSGSRVTVSKSITFNY